MSPSRRPTALPSLPGLVALGAACASAPAWAQSVTASPAANAWWGWPALLAIGTGLGWVWARRTAPATPADSDQLMCQAVLEQGPQFIGLMDDQGRLLKVNAAGRAWLGGHDHTGQPLWSLPGWTDPAAQADRLEQAVRGALDGLPARLELRLTSRRWAVANWNSRPAASMAARSRHAC
jgi:PAS domain-containing protein